MVASVLTTVYALVQMLVLVGIIIQIAEEGPCSPTALFFFYVTATFLLAAVLHPQVVPLLDFSLNGDVFVRIFKDS